MEVCSFFHTFKCSELVDIYWLGMRFSSGHWLFSVLFFSNFQSMNTNIKKFETFEVRNDTFYKKSIFSMNAGVISVPVICHMSWLGRQKMIYC